MNFDWYIIKDKLKLNCSNAFKECNLSVSDSDLDEALVIFKNLITLPMPGCDSIRGLEIDFCEALMQVFTESIGQIHYLETITTDYEAFFKKILIITQKQPYINLQAKTWMLWNLAKEVGLCPLFVASNNSYNNVNIDSYKTDQEACYIIFSAFRSRNAIHNAPILDLAQWATILKYSVATYIWTIIQTKEEILRHKAELSKELFELSSADRENRYIIDFLSFGKSTNDLKNQIVNSFILNKVYNTNPLACDVIVSEVQAFSNNTLGSDAIRRFISKLHSNKQLEYTNAGKTAVTLTPTERQRLDSLSAKYAESIQRFKNQLEAELSTIGIIYEIDAILDAFSEFFNDNFNNDILAGIDNDSFQQYKNYTDLKRGLLKLGFSEVQTEELFRKVVLISKNNDILYRLSMGRAYGRISNNFSFSILCRQQEREVYLDTQIVLYILCLNRDLPKPKIGRYQVASNLIQLKKQQGTNLKLLFPKVYLNEVYTHFRRALSLIQFTRNSHIDGKQISNNIFYLYYCQLKDDNDLPENVASFEDYMDFQFNLYEHDLFDNSFNSVVNDIVNSILSDNCVNIFRDIPHYSEEELSTTMKIMSDEIAKDVTIDGKDPGPLKTDAIVGRFLFSESFYTEPFFLTYDKSFLPFKSSYIKKICRKETSYVWHLLTPSQFINHIDLINLQINEERLTNELLSIIESDGYERKTQTVVDNLCRFMDIPDIAPEEKENKLKIIVKSLVGNGEYSHDLDIVTSETSVEIKDFCELCNSVMNTYIEKGGESLSKYHALCKDDQSFKKMISIIKTHVLCKRGRNINQIIDEIEMLNKDS